MTKALLIVFVKNPVPGKVKTRLAKTIGDQAAFKVYSELVNITEKATENIAIDKRIYFSEALVDSQWKDHYKAIQNGADLGARMKNAFATGFQDGYKNIVLIGSDLPDINASYIETGLQTLKNHDVVFGPAIDGGYYLIGMKKIHPFIFDNKPWSQSNLLQITLEELKQNNISFGLLKPLNDIDTFEDLKTSAFYKSNTKLQQTIKQLHD